MTFQYPEINEAERAKLVAMGWLFNPREGIWMYAPGDVSFSANQADHDRQFPGDLVLAKLQVLADESAAEHPGTLDADTLNGAMPGSEDRTQEQQEANKPEAATGVTAGPTGEQGATGEAAHTPEYKTD